MLIDNMSTKNPADVLGEELRIWLAVRDIRHGDVARQLGRSASYVSARLHGRAEFTEADLATIACMLQTPSSWFAYPGHTMRRLQKLESFPHSLAKVLLRLAGWQRARGTGHFTVWQHPRTGKVIPLPRNEKLLVPTVTWWVIDTLMGVKLASRLPVQSTWEVHVHRENNTWLMCLPYARAYTQTTSLTGIRQIATEFTSNITRKPINELDVAVTVFLPTYNSDAWEDGRDAPRGAGHQQPALSKPPLDIGFTLDGINIAMPTDKYC